MSSERKPLSWSTHFWVIAYTIGYMILTVAYCAPRLIIAIVGAEANFTWLSATATDSIPLDIFAWGLLAICAGYSGIDRASLATKSSLMEVGACDMGDPAKVRSVIYALCAIFVESVALNFFFGNDFTTLYDITYRGVALPLEGISSALVTTVTAYVLGNKSIRLTQTLDRTKENEDWADEKQDRVYVKHDKPAVEKSEWDDFPAK